jgi:uncharacterized lipoprotein YbaY
MAFALKYYPEVIVPGHEYSLQVLIRNPAGDLLYINDVHIGVTPSGITRTAFIDVPVILVRRKNLITIIIR